MKRVSFAGIFGELKDAAPMQGECVHCGCNVVIPPFIAAAVLSWNTGWGNERIESHEVIGCDKCARRFRRRNR